MTELEQVLDDLQALNSWHEGDTRFQPRVQRVFSYVWGTLKATTLEVETNGAAVEWTPPAELDAPEPIVEIDTAAVEQANLELVAQMDKLLAEVPEDIGGKKPSKTR